MSAPCVMLIEADVVVRTELAQYLRECGFRVVEAFDAAEARSVLASGKITLDVILLDAAMAEGTGFAFAAWLRAHYPGVEVIMSGSMERKAVKAAELCEEGPAQSRPYDHSLVLEEIRRRLAARDREAGDY